MGGACVKTAAKSDELGSHYNDHHHHRGDGSHFENQHSGGRRSVRIALDDREEKGQFKNGARHSQSAPDIQLKHHEVQSPHSTSSTRKKVRHSTTTYSVGVDKEVEEEEFQHMLRQFTRKSMSGDQLESPPQILTARRGPRRDSRIDDRDVLKLIATKSKNPEDKEELMKLEKQGSVGVNLSIDEAKEVAPHLVERIQRRRQTMEKLDIFSPDAAPERLEELYEATEKLIAHEDAEKKHTAIN